MPPATLIRPCRILCAALALLVSVGWAWAWPGQLVDPEGEPLRGARITPLGASGGTLTDAEGRFDLPAMPPPIVLLVELADGRIIIVRVPENGGKPERRLVVDPELSEEVFTTAPVAAELLTPAGTQPWTVGRREIAERGEAALGQVLAELPGSEPRSPDPDRVPVFRGMADGRTLFLFDGATIGSERRAGVSGGGSHPITWGGVEVARGPGALVYGSGAIGGVVLVKSPWASLAGDGRRSVVLEGSAGDAPGVSAAALFEQDGWIASLGVRSNDDPDAADGSALRAGYDQGSGFVGRSWSTDGSVYRVGLRADRLEDAYRPEVAASSKQTLVPRDQQLRAVFQWERPGKREQSLVAWWGQGERLIQQLREAPTPTRSTDTSLGELGARWLRRGHREALRWTWGAEARLRYGVEAEQLATGGDLDPEDQGEPLEDGEQRALALFGTATRSLGDHFELAAGARIEPVRSSARWGENEDARSETAWAGSLSLSTRRSRFGSVSLQLARSFRVPTLTDRYLTGITGRGFKLASPDLDPETALQVDIGWHYEQPRVHLSASLFRYRIEDVLVRDFLEEEVYTFVNGGEATVEGLEVAASFEIVDGLDAGLTAHVIRGETGDDGFLASVPADGVRLRLRKSFARGAYLRGEFVVYDGDNRPGSGEEVVPGFAVLDLGGGVRLAEGLTLGAVLQNALDKERQISARDGDPVAPGRTLVLSLRWAR